MEISEFILKDKNPTELFLSDPTQAEIEFYEARDQLWKDKEDPILLKRNLEGFQRLFYSLSHHFQQAIYQEETVPLPCDSVISDPYLKYPPYLQPDHRKAFHALVNSKIAYLAVDPESGHITNWGYDQAYCWFPEKLEYWVKGFDKIIHDTLSSPLIPSIKQKLNFILSKVTRNFTNDGYTVYLLHLFHQYCRLSARYFFEKEMKTPALDFYDLLVENILLPSKDPNRLQWWMYGDASEAARLYAESVDNITAQREPIFESLLLDLVEIARLSFKQLVDTVPDVFKNRDGSFSLYSNPGYFGISFSFDANQETLDKKKIILCVTLSKLASNSLRGQLFVSKFVSNFSLKRKMFQTTHAVSLELEIVPTSLSQIVDTLAGKPIKSIAAPLNVQSDAEANSEMFYKYLVHQFVVAMFGKRCYHSHLRKLWLVWVREQLTESLNSGDKFTGFRQKFPFDSKTTFINFLQSTLTKIYDMEREADLHSLTDEEVSEIILDERQLYLIQRLLSIQPVNCIEPVLTLYSNVHRYNFASLAYHNNFNEEKPCSRRCLRHAILHNLWGNIIAIDLIDNFEKELGIPGLSLYSATRNGLNIFLSSLVYQKKITETQRKSFEENIYMYRRICQHLLDYIATKSFNQEEYLKFLEEMVSQL